MSEITPDTRLFFNHHTGQKGFSHQVSITPVGTTAQRVHWLVKGGENIGRTDGFEFSLSANCENCAYIFPREFNFYHQMCLGILDENGYTFINWSGPKICPSYENVK